MTLDFRPAAEGDLDLLAEWNRQLIQDEGHRNRMTLPELRERMKGWLAREYKGVIFAVDVEPVAYALYRENDHEIYLRQFFVARQCRRQGVGRMALEILRSQLWSRTKRLTVDVLVTNAAGVNFWRAVGYKDYSLYLEIVPK